MDLEIMLEMQGGEVEVRSNGVFSHKFLLSQVALEIAGVKQLPLPWEDPTEYGKALFIALFQPGSCARVDYDSHPQRILLVANDPLIQSVAWEYLYGPRGFLVCELYFVRGIPSGQRQPPTSLGPLEVIVIPSNPAIPGNDPLPVESEWEELKKAVADVDTAITFTRARPSTLAQLRKLIAGKRNQVVHFLGHGNQDADGKAYLCFEKEDSSLSQAYPLEFYNRIKNCTFLVTLCACKSATPGPTEFSNLALALVEQGIPYVLGMQFVTQLDSTQILSRLLYADLARGSSVEEALLQARMDLLHSDLPWAVGIPVLYTSLTSPAGSFQHIDGQPVFAEQIPLPSMELMDVPKPETIFYGRAVELAQLGTWLTGPNRMRLVTIHGGGGQGKTALARAAAERFAWAWPGGVWASNFETIPLFENWLSHLASFCEIKTVDLDLDQIEKALLKHLHMQTALLILDNAEILVEALHAQQENAFEFARFLRLVIGETGCSLLVTSRWLLRWNGEQPLELVGLLDMEGARLFLCLTDNRISPTRFEDAVALSRAVEGHPLSLRLMAGAFLDFPGTLDEFMLDLDRQMGLAVTSNMKYSDRHYNLDNCLATSWKALSPELRGIWLNLSIFHGLFQLDTATWVLAGAEADEATQKAAQANLIQLQQRGLLEAVETQPLREGALFFYHMPISARLFADNLNQEEHEASEGVISKDELEELFTVAYVDKARWLYNHQDSDSRTASLFRAIREELERALLWSKDDQSASYLLHLGWLYFCYGLPIRGRELLEEGYAQIQGSRQLLELQFLNNLGRLFRNLGQKQRALEYYEKGLQIMKEVDDRRGEATTLTNIGGVYDSLGQKQKALEYHEQALPIWREVGDRGGEAVTLNNIGMVYNSLGQKQKALGYIEQALLIVQEVNERKGEAVTLNNIGGVYNSLGQKQKALEYYIQALPIWQEVGDRGGEATTLNNIGAVYKSIDQPQKALGYFNQALLIKREVVEREGEVTTLTNIGLVYNDIGQKQKALEYYNQALPILREVGDRGCEAMTLLNIARIFLDQDQPEEAVELLRQVVEIDCAIGAAHRQAEDQFFLAQVLHNLLGRTEEAISLIQQSIRLFQELNLDKDGSKQKLAQYEQFLAELQSSMTTESQD